ncbi:MAG: metallophosphoesterase [Candidatus Bathyarchaeia archaeon]
MLTPLWPYPAAFLKTDGVKTLVIADLHIGWEIALSEKGIHIPTQAPKILQRIKSLTAKYNPERLLILGDVKHTVAKAEISEWQDIPEFFNELKPLFKEIQIIRGNHDGNLEPLLPESVKILPSTGTVMGDVGFFHGHQWPSPILLKCKTIVMGHVHPVVTFRDPAGFRTTRQVWVRMDCDKNQLAQFILQKHKVKIDKSPGETLLKHYRVNLRVSQLFIMPSFNEFLGGKPLNEGSRGEKPRERVVGPILRVCQDELEKAEAYFLDGTFLGRLSQLKALS